VKGGYQQEKARVWLVSAQPSRAVRPARRDTTASPASCPTNDIFPGDRRRLDRPEHPPVALKDQGAAPSLDGARSCRPRKAGAAHRPRIFRPSRPGPRATLRGGGGKAAARTVDPGKMQPGDFVVHRNHGIGRFLEARENLRHGEFPRLPGGAIPPDGTLRGGGRTKLGSLGRYRASSGRPTRSNAWAGWPGAGPRTGPQDRPQGGARISSSSMPNATRAPGSPSPPMAPGSWSWGGFPSPLRAHPRTQFQGRFSEVRREHWRSPRPMGPAGSAGDVGLSGKPKWAIRGPVQA